MRSEAIAHVIVELGDDPLDEKCMRFFDQEYNEVRWYEFTPGGAEIEEVKRLISQSSRYSWLDCVRIDMSQVRTTGHPLVMSADRTDGAQTVKWLQVASPLSGAATERPASRVRCFR